MSFARHNNNDVQAQLRAGLVPTPLPLIFGQFRNKETNVLFEYAERRWFDDTIEPAMPHVIYTIDGTRLAKVLKTVAFVLTGDGIVEKWPIKQHREYDTQWVR